MERRLAAILAADVVGYSRLMGEDEAGTHAALKAHRADLIDPKAAQYNGHTVKLTGDGALMEFPSVVEAVGFAVEVQLAMRQRNAELPEERQILYRIGINIGDVIVEQDDIYGDGVNLAARLEGLAEPGGICLARNVFNQVKAKLDITFEHLGEKQVKNIAEPVSVYRVVMDDKAERLITAVQASAPPRRLRPALIAAGIALVAVIGAGMLGWLEPWRQLAKPVSSTSELSAPWEQPSIAVLPLENFSGDASLDYVSDGISEDIITALARSPYLLVMSRTSSFSYKGQSVTAQQVGEQLGVRYVLEGSVQKGQGKVRITAQLIEASSGHHLWAERFDQESADVLAIQESVAEKITQSLGQTKTGLLRKITAKNAWIKEGVALEEYDYMLRGHDLLLHWTEEDTARAREIFEEGLQRFPDSALLRTKVAWAIFQQAVEGWIENPEADVQRATALAQEAVADKRAPLLAEHLGHWVLAWLYADRFHDASRGLKEAEIAVSLVPGHGMARADLGGIQIIAGLVDEGLRNLEIAERVEPGYGYAYLYKSWGLLMRGKYQEAVLAAERFPAESFNRYLHLASCYAKLNRLGEAKKAVTQATKLHPGITVSAYRELMPFTDQQFVEEYLDDLRKAGLPE